MSFPAEIVKKPMISSGNQLFSKCGLNNIPYKFSCRTSSFPSYPEVIQNNVTQKYFPEFCLQFHFARVLWNI